jgi:hypothetical protein
MGLKEAPHQAPLVFFWFEASLDQEQFIIFAIKPEHYTINRNQNAGLI